jgi:hypothetical protein
MSVLETCEVCAGTGEYPIINRHGSHLYSIQCPECFGLGSACVEPETAAEAGLPFASTASRIRTLDQLRAHVASENAAFTEPEGR